MQLARGCILIKIAIDSYHAPLGASGGAPVLDKCAAEGGKWIVCSR
jgi:hypothetical protein